MNLAFVILWIYSDGSSCGVVKVYSDESAAKEDLEMLSTYGDGLKCFKLVAAPYRGDRDPKDIIFIGSEKSG